MLLLKNELFNQLDNMLFIGTSFFVCSEGLAVENKVTSLLYFTEALFCL